MYLLKISASKLIITSVKNMIKITVSNTGMQDVFNFEITIITNYEEIGSKSVQIFSMFL